MKTMLAFLLPIAALPALADDRPDVVVADFEGDDYAGWTTTGTAFGLGPARGTLPGQMHVEGFDGRGLANSFEGGDDATGTLVSPPFVVRRRYLNFLIGGGKYPGETCLDLLVEGSAVRTATGPNDKPGGSERLNWASWDVAEFEGKEATLRVVDGRKGGWGHVSVDQIVQSDIPRGDVPTSREFVAEADYLRLPVRTGAPIRRVRLEADGRLLDEFDIELAGDRPGFWTFRDINAQRGARLKVSATLPPGSEALGRIIQTEDPPGAPALYREPGRPQFHFTARRGWLNDPNGLVYDAGLFHLFFQHNPYGWAWGNMHWGHATSVDLVHWEEKAEALTPRRYGDWCFSGSAVVDRENTSGFGRAGRDDGPPLVLAYTSTGRGECIAFSNDEGRTWTEFAGNPVVKHEGRDPRLLWHGPTKRWVMAVYDETGGGRAIALYTSPDLRRWSLASRIDGFFECPDLFDLRSPPGQPKRTRWYLSAADGRYVIGDFDGKSFTPATGKVRFRYGDFYAAQTFSNRDEPTGPGPRDYGPRGRVIQIGWARGIEFPGMPFNQQMTLPCELITEEAGANPGLLRARPVEELTRLRKESHSWRDLAPRPGDDPLAKLEGDLWEILAEVEAGKDGKVAFDAGGTPIAFDAGRDVFTCGKHEVPRSGDGRPSISRPTIDLHIFVDRGSVELFADDGRVTISAAATPRKGARPLSVATTGPARIIRLDVHALKSAWR